MTPIESQSSVENSVNTKPDTKTSKETSSSLLKNNEKRSISTKNKEYQSKIKKGRIEMIDLYWKHYDLSEKLKKLEKTKFSELRNLRNVSPINSLKAL